MVSRKRLANISRGKKDLVVIDFASLIFISVDSQVQTVSSVQEAQTVFLNLRSFASANL